MNQNGQDFQELDIFRCYRDSAYLSFKHSSYFQTYEDVLAAYRNKPIVFVEVGVYNGGSLFMWRQYFGPEARIIGLDLNPGARKWEKDGFEIHIGNQGDPAFWDDFFAKVGDVDIILDDGGHTNEQQIVTTHQTLPHIRDGGLLIVEDTHTSYFRDFGNPSRRSFMSYAKTLIDSVNSRFPAVHASKNRLNEIVWSIGFYESIVCFKVDRRRCFISAPTTNGGISSDAEDFRGHGTSLGYIEGLQVALGRTFAPLKRLPFVKSVTKGFFGMLTFLSSRITSMKLGRYFQ